MSDEPLEGELITADNLGSKARAIVSGVDLAAPGEDTIVIIMGPGYFHRYSGSDLRHPFFGTEEVGQPESQLPKPRL